MGGGVGRDEEKKLESLAASLPPFLTDRIIRSHFFFSPSKERLHVSDRLINACRGLISRMFK